jgi:hypothetical protein
MASQLCFFLEKPSLIFLPHKDPPQFPKNKKMIETQYPFTRHHQFIIPKSLEEGVDGKFLCPFINLSHVVSIS